MAPTEEMTHWPNVGQAMNRPSIGKKVLKEQRIKEEAKRKREVYARLQKNADIRAAEGSIAYQMIVEEPEKENRGMPPIGYLEMEGETRVFDILHIQKHPSKVEYNVTATFLPCIYSPLAEVSVCYLDLVREPREVKFTLKPYVNYKSRWEIRGVGMIGNADTDQVMIEAWKNSELLSRSDELYINGKRLRTKNIMSVIIKNTYREHYHAHAMEGKKG